MTTATQPQAPVAPATGPKQQFIDVWTREQATTRRLLAAFPDEHAELRPHERSKTARELAFTFVRANGAIAAAVSGQWTWPPQSPTIPDRFADVLAAFDATSEVTRVALAAASESQLAESVQFPSGPYKVGEIPVLQLVWFLVMDAIHHRGQLSVYLRMAGGKVPSIYGPTADEPWR